MKRDSLLPALIGLAFLALCLALPSRYYNFDGVACAIAVELGDLKHLVHGNHLLYGLSGWLLHRALGAVGLPLTALWTLQLMNSIFGALGAALMFRLLRRQGFTARVAALCSAGLALSYCWWYFSLEAQVYVFAGPFLILALDEALSDRPSPYRLALFHSLAMLSHVSHALFVGVPLYALWRSRAGFEERQRDVGRYFICASLLVLTSYLAALALWVRPADVADVKVWLLGSAALGPGRTLLWFPSNGPLQTAADWCSSSGKAVSSWPLFSLPLWGAGLWMLVRDRGVFSGAAGRERDLVRSGWLWLAAYPLLFSHYEPYSPDYRTCDLIPLWVMAAAFVRRLPDGLGGKVAFAFVAALGAVNLGAGILPISRPEANRTLQKTLWLKEATPEDAWVAALSSDEVYLPYFAHRHPLNLRYYQDPRALAARVRMLERQGHPVYVTSDNLRRQWRRVFAPLRLSRAGQHGDIVLYRVRSP